MERISPLKKSETASVNTTSNIVDPNLCPVCNKAMDTILVGDIPSLCCLSHRICMPKKDNN